MSKKNLSPIGFDEMQLSAPVSSVLQDIGYTTPTPIQAMAIPHMIKKKDILAQAKTGTGKTAAFALPLLSDINIKNKSPQILVLTPTRELAIQVGNFFKSYGTKIKGLRILSVYGGKNYIDQLNQLKKGVHIIVGTPGRLMDHMRRKTISLKNLTCVVIDEADEMLHMGFIDDIEWILDKVPENAQTALFSATMPNPIRKIAQKYLNKPQEIIIKPNNKELDSIDQQFWEIKGVKKIQGLIRILSASSFKGVIVFVNTKAATLEIAKTLEEHGFRAEALNGDLAQNARERTISRLKSARIDILVATDVAARGLDVDRISHVINYDLPRKIEPYIHRIGRTGRAGKTGKAISFIGRRERWILKSIEKKTKQKIKELYLPSTKAINEKKIADFKNKINMVIESEDINSFSRFVESYAEEKNISMSRVAAALVKIIQEDTNLALPMDESVKENGSAKERENSTSYKHSDKNLELSDININNKKNYRQKTYNDKPRFQKNSKIIPLRKNMEKYRIEIGRHHGIKPGDIVGAISNEAGLDSKYIGTIDIDSNYSFVELPVGMPEETFMLLKNTWVRSRKMAISKCA